MIKSFTLEQLDARCKERPEGYREDLLSVAEEVESGLFIINTDDPKYTLLLKKYAPSTSIRANARANPTETIKKQANFKGYIAEQKAKRRNSSMVQVTALVDKADSILNLLTKKSTKLKKAFKAYDSSLGEKGCTSCRRNKLGRDIVDAFLDCYKAEDEEVQKQLRVLLGKALAPMGVVYALRK